MNSLDLSTVFIDAGLLNELYNELDIKAGSMFDVRNGHFLDFDYRTSNQITMIQVENNQHKIVSYASAQNYYKSAKALVMSGPELADKVRRSIEPETDSWVTDEQYKAQAAVWEKMKIDVAFKANWLKYRQNKDLAHELLLTGNRQIVVSENLERKKKPDWRLITAKILMVIREDLTRQPRK